MRDKPLLLIVGYSGVGKTAILQASGLSAVVSDTSRERREGELHGYDYYFRGRMEIEMDWQKHKQGRAKVYSYDPPKLNYSNYYCAKDEEILTKDAMIIDIESAIKLRGMIDSVIVWIDGEVRAERQGRSEGVPRKMFLQNFDYIVNNRGSIEDAVEKLLRHHSHAIKHFRGEYLERELKQCKERCKDLERQLNNKERN